MARGRRLDGLAVGCAVFLSGAAGLGVGLLVLVGAALVARMYAAILPATVLALCGLLLMGTGDFRLREGPSGGRVQAAADHLPPR